jgi:hypothetical protein
VPRDDKNAAPLRHIHVNVPTPGQSGLTVLTRKSYRYDESAAK